MVRCCATRCDCVHEVMLMYNNMEPLTTEEQVIVSENIGLVVFYAKRWMKMSNNRYDIDDLVQCGIMGLMRSAKTWNPDKGAMSTYSHLEINRAIQSWIIGDNNIKPSEHKALVSSRIKKRMSKNPDLTYESEEIRKMYQRYKPETIKKVVESPTYISCHSTDNDVCNSAAMYSDRAHDSRSRFSDIVADSEPISDEILEQKQELEDLHLKIDKIPLARPSQGAKLPRDMKRIILKECCLRERTLESVGKEYGVTREWIRQLRDLALDDLRRLMK